MVRKYIYDKITNMPYPYMDLSMFVTDDKHTTYIAGDGDLQFVCDLLETNNIAYTVENHNMTTHIPTQVIRDVINSIMMKEPAKILTENQRKEVKAAVGMFIDMSTAYAEWELAKMYHHEF